jgi:endogenous inhibitor of DNA gyrase (YacG/DUF329 family)
VSDKVADLAARRAQRAAGEAAGGGRRPKARRCPICGKPADPAHRPFCSPRCRRIDLDRWLGEVYRVPAEEPAGGAGGEGEEET